LSAEAKKISQNLGAAIAPKIKISGEDNLVQQVAPGVENW